MRHLVRDAKAMARDNHRDRDRLCRSSPNAGQLSDLREYRELQVTLTLHLGKHKHRLAVPASTLHQLVRDEFRVLG